MLPSHIFSPVNENNNTYDTGLFGVLKICLCLKLAQMLVVKIHSFIQKMPDMKPVLKLER